tara:strand:+ start:221 stop:634 length:414 start_codon:yes stop_codon:yes gene_type:complete
MAFKMKGSALYGRGNQSKSSPTTKVKETDAEFEARMKEQGMTIAPSVEVKKSDKLTQRDILAKQVETGKSGNVSKGMEQSAKSLNYAEADKYMANTGNKKAKELVKNRAARVTTIKTMIKNNPDMTQKEIDKAMSQS